MPHARDALYRRHRLPAEMIGYAVQPNFRFPPSLRMIGELLVARGIVVTLETIRSFAEKFGREFSNRIRRPAVRGDKCRLDEGVITIAGKKHWLRRADDQDDFVFDILVQNRRDGGPARLLMRKLSKKSTKAPRVMITDALKA